MDRITIAVDEDGLDECLEMTLCVLGEMRQENLSVGERFDELMRLGRIFSRNDGQVAFDHNEDWRTAGRAGTPLIILTPSKALRELYATVRARQVDGMVKEVVHSR